MTLEELKIHLFKTVDRAFNEYQEARFYGEMTEDTFAARAKFSGLYDFLVSSGLEDEYIHWKYKDWKITVQKITKG